jgi:excisionase family DNA binding protein
MSNDEYIEVLAAAEALGVSRATMYNLINERGIVTYKQPGNRRALITRADFETLRRPVPRVRGPRRGGESNE